MYAVVECVPPRDGAVPDPLQQCKSIWGWGARQQVEQIALVLGEQDAVRDARIDQWLGAELITRNERAVPLTIEEDDDEPVAQELTCRLALLSYGATERSGKIAVPSQAEARSERPAILGLAEQPAKPSASVTVGGTEHREPTCASDPGPATLGIVLEQVTRPRPPGSYEQRGRSRSYLMRSPQPVALGRSRRVSWRRRRAARAVDTPVHSRQSPTRRQAGAAGGRGCGQRG